MYEKVSVLVPTRQRLQRLETLLESYERTHIEDNSELVFRVDDDDEETISFLESRAGMNKHSMLVGPRLKGYQSMPTFFNELTNIADGDVLMCGNDDMVFQTLDWAGELLKVARMFPDGLFDLGVSTLNETHYPFATVSKAVAECLGFLWDPRIFWGDIFLRDVMAVFDRCVMVEHVRIDHDWAGFRPDRVFMESDKDITGKDPTYWSGTHRTAVDEAVSRLRRLLV